jgi:hypothetical protein
MKRKIISCALVASISFSIGCYNTQTITREQLQATTKEELKAKADKDDITVFTKGSLEYEFSKGNYRIQGDTLIGFGVQTIDGNDRPFHGAISFADITSLETEKFNLGITILAIGLPVGLVVGLLSAWASHMGSI